MANPINAGGIAFGRQARANGVRAITLANGGGTFGAKSWASYAPSSGYAVGIANGDGGITDIANGDLAYLLEQVERIYEPKFIGTWVCGDHIVVDPITIVPTIEEARAIGKITHQEAIYSFAEAKSITL